MHSKNNTFLRKRQGKGGNFSSRREQITERLRLSEVTPNDETKEKVAQPTYQYLKGSYWRMR
jgi:hypothetical protein